MPEMISKKLLTLKRLTRLLEGINPNNTWIDEDGNEQPFTMDLTNSVFRGRVVFGDEVKPPFIAILEAPRQINPNGGGSDRLKQDEDWTLLIQGFATDDPYHPSDPAYLLLAYVQARLARITEERTNGGRGGVYPEDYHLGGLTGKISFQIPIVRPGKDDVSDTAYFYMPVSIETVTDLSRPIIKGD